MPRTQINDLEAVWHREPTRIGIQEVRHTANAALILSYPPEMRLDLVEARVQYPELAALWNAIRHDFWATRAASER